LVQKQARHAKLDTLLMYDRRDNELKVYSSRDML
jgi:hypothetical protein